MNLPLPTSAYSLQSWSYSRSQAIRCWFNSCARPLQVSGPNERLVWCQPRTNLKIISACFIQMISVDTRLEESREFMEIQQASQSLQNRRMESGYIRVWKDCGPDYVYTIKWDLATFMLGLSSIVGRDQDILMRWEAPWLGTGIQRTCSWQKWRRSEVYNHDRTSECWVFFFFFGWHGEIFVFGFRLSSREVNS